MSLPPPKELNSELSNLINGQIKRNQYKKHSTLPLISQSILNRKTKTTTSMTKSSKSKHPLVTLCLVGGIIVFTIYIIVFIEIDGINIYNILTQKRNINDYNIFKTPDSQLLQLELEPEQQIKQHQNSSTSSTSITTQFNMENSDGYFEMFEHIHSTPFEQLSTSLQTRHLHELFRFKVMEMIHNRQKNGDKKQPGQGDLLTLLHGIYSQHETGINFVQIGACDGDFSQSNDPIQKFILSKRDWHGVMLEPVPYLFEKLKTNIAKSIPDWEKRIVPINAALSDHDGSQLFYIVNPHFAEEMPDETHALKHQIGSFNKHHIIKHLKIKRERVE